ncbi:5-(carboxyamino)imidazole ribonucleotide synthase [Siphonobacter sp. SORGH_AS_0500]|uniref:5-(carboxyamino)imidazole ribonucleotide synthase n=1 Tax=Siphonobacter sp. SORGH_AS_0500 TaxID=1864824 RepID=UPI000CB2F7D6|nr:5-(carboxyamino)imidazole ribonucleotide synthase [Siphonobacter sp. SORGH_AS_0500]MDR6196800.1 5-(carboxyamino)imidazole ribonucleotide synthase [Siphonobacter sp. SORGH_AS_0500]PKK36042.1 5-(carboxyamino)imidazole ribonucleotide synthase [Siphonobacter sp. SORGH_AS_0500]
MFNPGVRFGLLGGGQLGRMLLQVAIDFDLSIKVLDPDAQASCAEIAPEFVVGSFQDFDTVYAFGKDLEVITIEIEAVNLDALKKLQSEGVRVFPQPEIVEIIQDKRLQKQFYRDHNLPTSDFVLVENQADARRHADFLPAFNKLGKGGYDGRGVQRIATAADFDKAFDAPGLLEKAVDFEKELAVIVARNERGDVKTFPTVEMVFHPEANMVDYLFAPASIPAEVDARAQFIASRTAEAFGIVGLLAVEMFLTKDGEILINEVAPRPHNSGHHTLRANDVSQFEQHLRAVLNWPLGDTKAHSYAAMINLLGAEGYEGEAKYEGMETLLETPGVHPFLYGKKITKPFRKMGHITVVDKELETLKKKVEALKNAVRIIS